MQTLLLMLALAAGPAQSPVAVMPFKNLNKSAELQWLEVGIAETMISDLRKSGKVSIVERDQIDRALAEINLQGGAGTDVAQAVSVGKIVGARTIVVGSFQQAGKQLRITARFVTVETGVVQETAKATGGLNRVFALQDEITDRLVGIAPKKPAKRPGRPKRKNTTQAVRAYKLYAMSLATASDAQRVSLLKQAVTVDPELTYAVSDLRALERRMATLSKISSQRFDENEAKLRTRLYDEDVPEKERVQLAQTLLTNLVKARRFFTLSREAQRIYDLALGAQPTFDSREFSSFALVLSHERIRRHDIALQHGERHLKEFPAGPNYRVVEAIMADIVRERRLLAERRTEFAEEVASNQAERAELVKKHGKVPADREISLDYDICYEARWARIPDEIMKNCHAYIDKYAKSPDKDAQQFVNNARSWIIYGHSLRGDFKTAWELADKHATAVPGALDDVGIGTKTLKQVMNERWPTD